MNQTENGKGNLNDVVAEAIALTKKVEEMRATAIQQLLSQRKQIDEDLRTLGYSPSGNGHAGTGRSLDKRTPRSLHESVEKAVEDLRPTKRFRDLTLAQVGRQLLQEYDRLHGKEIERLAKAGGFKGGTKNFQNYMPVAFKRDGGFENIGGNTWRLKQPETA